MQAQTEIICAGTVAVVIYNNNTFFYANFYTNASGTTPEKLAHDATISLDHWKGKSLKGARKWGARKIREFQGHPND